MPRVSVGLGLIGYPFETAAGFWRWVDLCEAGGIDSLWQSDQLITREPTLESLSVMAALAGRTRRLKFGMSVVSLAFRDPVLLAKQCATIDVLSEGRLLPAFGIGSPRGPEWEALHVNTATRGAVTDEALVILQRLWTEDEVTFEGKHFRLTKATISPKPVQPDLPLWIGGSSEGAIRRTARYGTGWLASAETPEELAPLIVRIKAAVKAADRTIDEGHYGIGVPFHLGRDDDPALAPIYAQYRRFLPDRDPRTVVAVGDAEAIIARLSAYVAAGATKFVLRTAVRGDDAVIAQTRRLIAEVIPSVEALSS